MEAIQIFKFYRRTKHMNYFLYNACPNISIADVPCYILNHLIISTLAFESNSKQHFQVIKTPKLLVQTRVFPIKTRTLHSHPTATNNPSIHPTVEIHQTRRNLFDVYCQMRFFHQLECRLRFKLLSLTLNLSN